MGAMKQTTGSFSPAFLFLALCAMAAGAAVCVRQWAGAWVAAVADES
jgi:hypothetical protein